MFGNGVKIGMALMKAHPRRILQVLQVGRAVCAVVVAGSMIRGIVVRRSVTSSLQATVATSSGYDWFFPSDDIFSE